MIQKIIDGISIKINAEFGDGYEIYTEDVEQGLKGSCFYISCINPTSEQFLGRRYFRSNQFCIYYFSNSTEPKAECRAVLERFYNALEYIEVDGSLSRGTNMKGELSDDVLCFFVNFDVFVFKELEPTESMGELTHNGNVKE